MAINGLTIALDTLKPADTPQVIVDFMKQWHYNGLRLYVGWGSNWYTGIPSDPMNAATQRFVSEICRLCGENKFIVMCSVCCQVTPLAVQHPEDRQTVESGNPPYSNYMDPIGPTFRTFTKGLIQTLVRLASLYVVPWISLDEIVYTAYLQGTPECYSASMRQSYLNDTGRPIPSFPTSIRPWTAEQQSFINYVRNKIKEFYQVMSVTAYNANHACRFQALLDFWWVYTSHNFAFDTEPWEYYATMNNLCTESYNAVSAGDWTTITDGLSRIMSLDPSAKHYYLYGGGQPATVANMRTAIQLAMSEDYDGVFMYEFQTYKNSPFDVSDIVPPGIVIPPPITLRSKIILFGSLVAGGLLTYFGTERR